MLLSRIEQTGVTTHTLDLVSGLRSENHEVCLITGGKVTDSDNRINDFYLNFEKLGAIIKEFDVPSGSLLKKIITSISSIYFIIKTIKTCNPDIIHAQSPYMTFIPWLMGKKFTTTIHNTKLKNKIQFKKPTHLIAISNESCTIGESVFNIKRDDITIVNHGVSKRFSNPISLIEKKDIINKFNIPKSKIIVGFVGRLTRDKGCDILIHSIKKLKKETLDKVHFVFLGSTHGSKDHNWLIKQITEADIENFISIISFQDPKPFYDIFDIFILPSRMESFPLVTIEAMMSGCCPIRSNTEGAYEQIEEGVNGILFENESITGCTTALEKVINDDKLRLQFGNNAKEKALKNFTIPVMTKNTLKVYNKIRLK
ncbi:glycosyltransferase involved in cell wall biosynthesis [Maribacter vaceletii]|uniref:Glycosyltransferase involved in cell wall biosynthesis n=2 Tax=Maribacter vaceletii TaxID=1206816 RepID=A0A495DVR8_9FLAO|nr:glycosyltransferase involved in cell wall biosynthesis [Maribacter vaceletii]